MPANFIPDAGRPFEINRVACVQITQCRQAQGLLHGIETQTVTVLAGYRQASAIKCYRCTDCDVVQVFWRKSHMKGGQPRVGLQ